MARFKKDCTQYLPPNMRDIQKYEQEIAALEKKREQADRDRDWSMRNFYDAQLYAKRGNLEILKKKTRSNGNSIGG